MSVVALNHTLTIEDWTPAYAKDLASVARLFRGIAVEQAVAKATTRRRVSVTIFSRRAAELPERSAMWAMLLHGLCAAKLVIGTGRGAVIMASLDIVPAAHNGTLIELANAP
jgi:hypothetical protein